MKTALIFVLFFGFFAIVYSAVSMGDYSDPNHPGKCVIRPDLILSPGIHRDPKACERIICGESGTAEIQTCGVQLAGPDCVLGEYKYPGGDYPDCCELEINCL